MKTKHRNINFTSQQNLTLTNCKSICKTFANCNKKKMDEISFITST